ncbi:RsmE family RNA methyltransferase [Fontisphaera persica]|uniref:RsmE family RNA methyltransferase n=1 Tax=Fontisphaera persica TaxID=2974023 RepID=UPI0024C0C647|nr:RsmE family RNA methyltransferase [Fontisphaera persica]WCJ57954.1 RsmE family RNA methyltransferase [Fontisphaera persica]
MHRFYLPPEACAARPLQLTGDEAHHAARVLRLRRGEEVQILDGQGNQFYCTVSSVTPHAVELHLQRHETAPPPPAQITLFQALPKHKTWDTLLAKAVELGASRVIAVLTEHTVPHATADRQERQRARWQQAAIEACKQCGQPWLPRVLGPLPWTDALTLWPQCEIHLAGLLTHRTARVRDHLAAFRQTHGRWPASVGLWIGPEGDFSPAEVAALLERGVCPITLGPLVLRVDTAAIAALALVQDELLGR